MRMSVIIPTYNRAQSLPATLRALENQTLSTEVFEVIVVDDGSDDTTCRILRRFRPDYPYAFLKQNHGGLAAARNRGAERAGGDILYFLDDDVIPGTDTLEQHVKAHENGVEPMVVVGSLPYPDHIKQNPFFWYLEKRGHYDLYQFRKRKYPRGKPPLPPLNGNSSIPRDLFFKNGAYDESFTQYGGEDLELGYRLAKAGVRFFYHPQAVGYHNHTKSFSAFCMDMEKAGESLIRIYKKYPEIRSVKKIDILLDPITKLPVKKWLVKIILSTTLACPSLLVLPRVIVRKCASIYAFRHILFPLFHWVSQYHYALGMNKGLSQGK